MNFSVRWKVLSVAKSVAFRELRAPLDAFSAELASAMGREGILAASSYSVTFRLASSLMVVARKAAESTAPSSSSWPSWMSPFFVDSRYVRGISVIAPYDIGAHRGIEQIMLVDKIETGRDMVTQRTCIGRLA